MAMIIRPEDVVRILTAKTPSTSLARGYFRTTRNKNTTKLAVSEIKSTVGNVPVIRRGDVGYRPKMSADITFIEPQPIEIDDTISATVMDDYERATGLGKQQLIDNILSRWADVVSDTIKALCCQAHKGTIDYMMQAGDKTFRYTVDYGEVQGIEAGSSVDSLTVGTLVDFLESLADIPSGNGIGGGYEYIAARDVYRKIISLAANQTKLDVKTGKGYIDFGGYRIYRDNDAYIDRVDGIDKTKRLVDDKELMIRAEDAGQELDFLRIDDTVATQAVPLYAFTKDRADQRGTDIFVKSKPFPLVNVKGLGVLRFTA